MKAVNSLITAGMMCGLVFLRHLYLIGCLWLLSCKCSSIKTLWCERRSNLYLEEIWSIEGLKAQCFRYFDWLKDLPWLTLQYLLSVSNCCQWWRLRAALCAHKKSVCFFPWLFFFSIFYFKFQNGEKKKHLKRNHLSLQNEFLKQQWECCCTSQMWLMLNRGLPLLSAFWPWNGSHGCPFLLNVFVDFHIRLPADKGREIRYFSHHCLWVDLY